MIDEKLLAAALRKIASGVSDIAGLLDSHTRGDDDQVAREMAVLSCFDVPREQGLTMEQASDVFKRHGYEPRTSGAWARRGWIVRYDLSGGPPWTDRRCLTEAGRERLRVLHQQAA